MAYQDCGVRFLLAQVSDNRLGTHTHTIIYPNFLNCIEAPHCGSSCISTFPSAVTSSLPRPQSYPHRHQLCAHVYNTVFSSNARAFFPRDMIYRNGSHNVASSSIVHSDELVIMAESRIRLELPTQQPHRGSVAIGFQVFSFAPRVKNVRSSPSRSAGLNLPSRYHMHSAVHECLAEEHGTGLIEDPSTS
jgi:hypothetical protein